MNKKILVGTLVAVMSLGVTNFLPQNYFSAKVEAATMFNLNFDASRGIEKSLTYNGKEIKFFAYEDIVYVSNPSKTSSQSLSIFVPAEYLSGGTINGYTAKTAPIFLPNGVGGYMPGEILQPSENDRMTGGPNAQLVALSRGLVVVCPAIRGRTTKTENKFVGKAPAFIVDYKSAVRYLRFNRDKLPAGDTEKIISNGTSAGGALSAALGSMGNASEFEPYLKALGAADERDDIFASSDYCPITNLENADMAYEWIFNGVNNYFQAMWQIPGANATSDDANNPVESKKSVEMTEREIEVSKMLKYAFAEYVNSLQLKDVDGKILTLDENGEGSFKNYIKKKYIESAQWAIDNGEDLSAVDWVTVENKKVVDVDLKKYATTATRQKAAPAFDKLDLSSAENDEFGTIKNSPRHFSKISQKISGGKMANETRIKLMNPMNFIGRSDVKVAPHFRIRHGSVDRDTTLAIPAILALKLQNSGVDVDFFSPWGRGHSGDYDLKELFDWIDKICK